MRALSVKAAPRAAYDSGAAIIPRCAGQDLAPTAAAASPVRALDEWVRSSETAFGPVFRKVDRWGNVEHGRLGPDAWHRIPACRNDTPRRIWALLPLLGCESAVGFGADQRDKMLKSQVISGFRACADLQT